ncbi:MAG: aminoacyl-tRNA hydrolase [Clostridiales bacterium]|nr:aminoacyl-tRNA hydrolase [Clostridiales bacterium]
MKLIVGLGNPEGKYTNTYHNTGFNAVDFFVKKNGLKFTTTKCRAEICKGDGYIIAKPNTYMNLSGDSVQELRKYFKIALSDIMIILDDIDLPKGKIRYRMEGSAGTHNGLRDIVNKVGITPRLRIGIGRDENIPLRDYVLSTLDPTSKATMQEAYEKASVLIEQFIAGDLCQDTTI